MLGNPLRSNICERCQRNRGHCDRIWPSCTQCTKVGVDCRSGEWISPGSVPPGYYESAKEVYNERIKDSMSIWTNDELPTQAPREQKAHRKVTPRNTSKSDSRLHISTLEIKRNEIIANDTTEGKGEIEASEWLINKVKQVESLKASPTITLLVIQAPKNPALPPCRRRNLHDEVLDLIDPTLAPLGIPQDALKPVAYALFQKYYPDITHFEDWRTDAAQTYAYHIAVGDFCLAFRYFPESKSCVGFVLIQNFVGVATHLLRDLKANQVLVGEPLLIPLLAQRAMSKVCTSWLDEQRGTIVEAQSQAGLHHIVSLGKPPDFVDYTELSVLISGTASNLAINELLWKALLQNAKDMVEELQEARDRCGSDEEPTPDMVAAAKFMRAHASQLAKTAEYQLRETQSWQQSSMILLQGTFNLIAQQDQNTSIRIAQDSKVLAAESRRDTTSMKAIAVVTMTYLPGTFVATLFSMSIFKWDAKDGETIMNERFWIYGVVTIPLVFVTFLAWGLWLRYRTEKRPDEE